MVSNPEWLDIGSYKGAVSASSANASSTLVGKSVRAQMVGGGAPGTTATGSDFNYQEYGREGTAVHASMRSKL